MTVQLQYTGTDERWFETTVTGKSRGWRAGIIGEVSDGEAALLIATGLFRVHWASTLDEEGTPQPLSTAQKVVVDAIMAEYLAGTLGGASGASVAALFVAVYRGAVFDSGSGNTMPTVVATVNAATDIIAAERIQAGASSNAFESTVDGNSLTGEVITLRSTSAGVYITSVHVGHGNGASQLLATTTTVTTDQLAKFEFDAADEVVTAKIYISPPRGAAGRYMDIAVVGQQA